jgi:hypothetical protein
MTFTDVDGPLATAAGVLFVIGRSLLKYVPWASILRSLAKGGLLDGPTKTPTQSADAVPLSIPRTLGQDSDEVRRAVRSTFEPLDLKNHPFFTDYENVRGVQLRELSCGCPGRTLLARDLLAVVVDAWREAAEFLCVTSGTEKKAHIITAAVQQWELKTLDTIENGNYPAEAIESLRTWLRPVSVILASSSAEIAGTSSFRQLDDRVSCALFLYAGLMQTCISLVKVGLWSLNGRLDGVTYRGHSIQPTPSHMPADFMAEAFRLRPPSGTAWGVTPASSSAHRSVNKPKDESEDDYAPTTAR